jgi:lysozyme family protein
MASENYDFCIKKVLESEGGYSNDPADPGGPTNYGITIHDYRAYINPHGTAHDVKHMSVDQAKSIYRSKYWDAVGGDNLPIGVDYCVFDYGVNSGVSRALRVYRAYSKLSSIHAVNAICDERMRFLRRLRIFAHFGRGWTRRVAEVRRDSLWLITQMPNSPPQSKPSSIISLNPPTSKASPTLWQRMCSMVSFRGNAPTA